MESEEFNGINTAFLCCEMKPNWIYWPVLRSFAKWFRPAYTYGRMIGLNSGKLTRASFSILPPQQDTQLVFGYLIEFSPFGMMILDKTKGYNDNSALNYHIRRLSTCYYAHKKPEMAWVYFLSGLFPESETIDIKNGFWDHDDSELLEFVGSISH